MHRKHIRVILGGLLALGLFLPSRAARAERVQILATRLTVRDGPGTKHKRLGSAPKGRVYEVKERKGSWVAIVFGTRTGWVFGRHVRRVTGRTPTTVRTPTSTTTTHTVVATRLNVRSKASLKSKIRFRLLRGTRVSVKETRGGWLQIAHRGRTGWAMGKFLSEGEAAPPSRRVRPRRRVRPKPRRRPRRRRRPKPRE